LCTSPGNLENPPPKHMAATGAMSPEGIRDRSPRQRSRAQGFWTLDNNPDPDGLAEFSVVYTNRALNHMSAKFQQVMCDVSSTLKKVYNAKSVALIPGSGTFAMEAVARQFGTGQKCMVIRNGYFSYRWSQILEVGGIPSSHVVMNARPIETCETPSYAPAKLTDVLSTIKRERPAAVFAPHVETASGMMLPDIYLKEVADAVHEVGGLFVLDCIASGCVWVDMVACGVDVLISAPQKGWTGSPCVGMVMLSNAARMRLDETNSTCFAVDLKKWISVMEKYEEGGHMYHTTMPTDSIIKLRDVQTETSEYGFERVQKEQLELGKAVRSMLAKRGFKSVAAEGYCAPGVVVVYTDDDAMKSGAKFAAHGVQIAAGVPLMVDQFTSSSRFCTFRLGLFGLDKLHNIPATVKTLERAFDAIAAGVAEPYCRL